MRGEGGVARLSFRQSDPPAHGLLVPYPSVTEFLLQLPFLAPDEEIDEWKVKRCDRDSCRRAEQQARSKKDERVPAQIERVARGTVGTRREQRFLRNRHNDVHLVLVEEIRRLFRITYPALLQSKRPRNQRLLPSGCAE